MNKKLLSLLISIVICTAPVLAQVIDFNEGYTAGASLNGQNGWVATTNNWPNWQVTSNGTVFSSNNEIAVLEAPVQLAPGESYSLRIDFFLQEWDEPSNFVAPGEGVFYELWKFGLKTDPSTTLVEREDPLSGAIHVQGFAEGLRLMDGAYGSAMITEGVGMALGVSYSVTYTLHLGDDATDSHIDAVLTNNLDAVSVSGSINSIDPGLYADITTGDGAHLFMQTITSYGQDNGIDGLAVDTVALPITWNGLEADENGWINTADWLGWVNVTHAPWIWLDSFGQYAYMPEAGHWIFLYR